jgi:hypothetical protein
MQIVEAHSDPDLIRGYRKDIIKLLEQPSDDEARPCLGCTLVCPTCGSKSCSCKCSISCEDAPQMMSSEAVDFPIEANIVPLVYALNCLRLTQPCWSCEGHNDHAGELKRPPRVWFYTQSMTYPDLIAELLSDLDIAGRLSLAWHVCLVRWEDGPNITFSIEPKIKSRSKPELMGMRRDVQIIAENLMTSMKKIRTNVFIRSIKCSKHRPWEENINPIRLFEPGLAIRNAGARHYGLL